MKRNHKFSELFRTFEYDRVDFFQKIQLLALSPEDGDILTNLAADPHTSVSDKTAAIAIVVIHFPDRVNVKVKGEPDPKLAEEMSAKISKFEEEIERRVRNQ